MTAAQRLLVLASRTAHAPRHIEEMQRLSSREGIWPRIHKLSRRHRTLPLVGETVSRHLSGLPESVAHELRTEVEENRRRNLFLMGTLASLCRGMVEAGLEAVPYKGPLLALQAYGDVGRRMFHDLDLLVPAAQSERALQWLRSQGYEEISRDDYHSRLLKEPFPIVLEVHWAFVERYFGFSLNWQDVASRLTSLQVAGVPLNTLSSEDRFLVLSFHGAKHMWNRLGWVCDLAEWLKRTSVMDWDQVRRGARRHGIERVCRLGLDMARTLFDADVPVVWRGTDTSVAALRAACLEELFPARSQPADPRLLYAFHRRMRERRSDRFRYTWGRLLPTKEDPGAMRPRGFLRMLHFALRPIRIATKFLSARKPPGNARL